MAQVCPIIFRTIDGTIARINALWVTFFTLLFLASNEVFILYFLAFDFIIRLYVNKRYSLLTNMSKMVQHLFKLPKQMTDAGAKRLAAQLGLLFITLLLITYYLELFVVMYILATSLLVCTFLELAFSYCVGCQLYFLLQKLR